jgi:hypothetical protein
MPVFTGSIIWASFGYRLFGVRRRPRCQSGDGGDDLVEHGGAVRVARYGVDDRHDERGRVHKRNFELLRVRAANANAEFAAVFELDAAGGP